MKTIFPLCAFLAAVASSGCIFSPQISPQMYLKTEQDILSKIPQSCEIEQMFGSAKHSLSVSHGGVCDGLWWTETYFGNRYYIQMRVDVKVDFNAGRLISAGTPQFFVLEHTKVDIDSNGQAGSLFGMQHDFGPDEWKKVVKAGGDFTVIGVTIDKRPVPNFGVLANNGVGGKTSTELSFNCGCGTAATQKP